MSGFQLNTDEFRNHYNNLCTKWHELDAKASVMEGQVDQAKRSSLSGPASVFKKVGAAKENAAKDAQAQLASVRGLQAQMSNFLDAARTAFIDYGTDAETGAMKLLHAAEMSRDPAVVAASVSAGAAAAGIPGVAMAGVAAEAVGVTCDPQADTSQVTTEEDGVVDALGGPDAEVSHVTADPGVTGGGSVSKGPFNVGSIGLSDK